MDGASLLEHFSALDPELFKAAFVAWVEDLREAQPDIAAIDGKTSLGTATTRARSMGRCT